MSTPAPWAFKPKMEDDNQAQRWVVKEVAAGWGLARVSGIHSPLSPLVGSFSLICLDGCPLSGAQHDERPWLHCRLCLSCLHLGQW